MPQNLNPSDPPDFAFIRLVNETRQKIGRQQLDDNDLVILACEEISRTFTHEEKNYAAGRS
ncbi:MAG: hypothetical protein MUF22_10040 [Chitinispirillaceae bacterium]|jgi:hypothetical protein|nr:hypothetical protein [Chitinispirillaceae bacterium]